MKCFNCILEEYHQKIKWSQVEPAITIFDGKGYCFKHLLKELNLNSQSNEETKK